MDTYEISPHGAGWFQVTVIAPSGNSRIRRGFVSELSITTQLDGDGGKCRELPFGSLEHII
jgi:hypothetical protein